MPAASSSAASSSGPPPQGERSGERRAGNPARVAALMRQEAEVSEQPTIIVHNAALPQATTTCELCWRFVCANCGIHLDNYHVQCNGPYGGGGLSPPCTNCGLTCCRHCHHFASSRLGQNGVGTICADTNNSVFVCDAETCDNIIHETLNLLLGVPVADSWILSPWQAQIRQARADWDIYILEVPIPDPLTLPSALTVLEGFIRFSPTSYLYLKFAIEHPRMGRSGVREDDGEDAMSDGDEEA